jgi:hypothetical protein
MSGPTAAGLPAQTVAVGQLLVGVPTLQPGTGQYRLQPGVVAAPAAADTSPVAAQHPGQRVDDARWRVSNARP